MMANTKEIIFTFEFTDTELAILQMALNYYNTEKIDWEPEDGITEKTTYDLWHKICSNFGEIK